MSLRSINNNTNSHIFLSKPLFKKSLLSKTNSRLFMNKFPDLIIIFNADSEDYSFIKACIKRNRPIIVFGYNSMLDKQGALLSDVVLKFGLNLSKEQSLFYQFLINCIIKN